MSRRYNRQQSELNPAVSQGFPPPSCATNGPMCANAVYTDRTRYTRRDMPIDAGLRVQFVIPVTEVLMMGFRVNRKC